MKKLLLTAAVAAISCGISFAVGYFVGFDEGGRDAMQSLGIHLRAIEE